jgi:hypothetical protein
VRFRTLDDLPLDVIARAIAGTRVDTYIERYERSRHTGRKKSRAKSG